MKQTLLFLNGPNLGLLGHRDPKQYGTTTLAEIESAASKLCKGASWNFESLQSNSEGELVDFLNSKFLEHVKAKKSVGGIVINPGAYAHTSVAIRDALEVFSHAGVTIVEVHLSQVFAREEFRRKSITGEVASAMISGMGAHGYSVAVSHLIQNGSETKRGKHS